MCNVLQRIPVIYSPFPQINSRFPSLAVHDMGVKHVNTNAVKDAFSALHSSSGWNGKPGLCISFLAVLDTWLPPWVAITNYYQRATQMAFRFQCLSSLWHLEHLQLIVSFVDCCLSTDDKYCRAPQTSRAIFSSSVSLFCGNLAVPSSSAGKRQEGPGSQLGLGVTSSVQPHAEDEVNSHESRCWMKCWRLSEGLKAKFCPNLGSVSHFKPSHHKRSTSWGVFPCRSRNQRGKGWSCGQPDI